MVVVKMTLTDFSLSPFDRKEEKRKPRHVISTCFNLYCATRTFFFFPLFSLFFPQKWRDGVAQHHPLNLALSPTLCPIGLCSAASVPCPVATPRARLRSVRLARSLSAGCNACHGCPRCCPSPVDLQAAATQAHRHTDSRRPPANRHGSPPSRQNGPANLSRIRAPCTIRFPCKPRRTSPLLLCRLREAGRSLPLRSVWPVWPVWGPCCCGGPIVAGPGRTVSTGRVPEGARESLCVLCSDTDKYLPRSSSPALVRLTSCSFSLPPS